jgi:hypothetical protein
VTTYALGADERCQRIRIGMLGYASSTLDLKCKLRSAGILDGATSFTQFNGAQQFVVYGPWVANAPDTGTEWTQAKIDPLRVQIDTTVLGTTPAPDSILSEFWFELDIHKKPSVTGISSPTSGQVLLTPTTQVQWDYSGDGDVQKKYQMKVFDKTVVEGVGFSVDTSTAVYDSGAVQTSATNASPGNLTDGGNYYVYVKAAKDFNGTDWWSDWSPGRSFKINARPTCTVTAPTPTPVTTTSRPTAAWTYLDADGDVQSGFKMKWFKQTGGSWAGIIPEYNLGADLIYDTSVEAPNTLGFISGQKTTYRIPVPLAQTGVYRAYVKVRHQVPILKTSDWFYKDFTTNLPVPATPTLTVIGGNRNEVQLTLTKGAGVVDGQVSWYSIQRSFDEGATWEVFRYGTTVTTAVLPEIKSPANSAVYYDYEVPLGVTVQYRAWAAKQDPGADEFDSAFATGTTSLTGAVVWVKDPVDSTRSRHFYVQDKFLATKKTRVRSVQQPLGRDMPIVVRGDGRGRSFSATFLLIGQADYDAMLTLIDSDRTLYLQTPKGSLYVDIAADVDITPHLWDDLRKEEDVWIVTIPFVEVDRF